MPEIYTIQLQNSSLNFEPANVSVPDFVLNPTQETNLKTEGLEIICRMGDPDLIHCVVYKQAEKNGGIFAVYSRNNLLFVAICIKDLVFALAQGFLGQLVANVRYGVDIFENLELPDD